MSNDQVIKSYLEENREVRFQRSKIGCLVTLALVPTGASLDLGVYPEHSTSLLMLRFVSWLLVAMIYLAHRFQWFRNHIKWTGMLMPAVLVGTFCAMIYVADGFTGPYYAGLNLLIVGVSLLLPYSFIESFILSAGALGFYILTGAVGGLNGIDFSLAYSNIYFIFSTGVIACTASFFSERARFREFRLTYELDQRNRQLAELDRIKSDFFANVSHELRTPLTLILSPIEDLMKHGTGSKHVDKQLEFVKDNAYRLLKLVNDLLQVMRLEEGRSNLDKRAINLSTMVSNVVAGMRHFAAQQQVSLEVESEESVVIAGDSGAVEKITINLVNNAIKFTEPGGTVRVSVRSNAGFGELKVVDTGTGISASDLPHIFDRFKQADSSSTRKHQGTGLGLALVRELTELQDGTIEARSELGKGTTMAVKLPTFSEEMDADSSSASEIKEDSMDISKDHLAEIHRKAAYSFTVERVDGEDELDTEHDVEESSTESLDSQGQRPKVVVVEDEPDVRRYLTGVLGKDFDLQVAKDGEEGLELVRSAKPDIALLDLMLPKLDGLTVCKSIKEDPELQHIKVMLLTARTDEESKMTALDHGADDFLTKPFSTVEISKRLFNLWHTSRLQETLRVKNVELSNTLDELQSTQGKLIQSEKLNALGRLAAGLLHEVNNPLNYAFGTFQLLEREEALQSDQGIKEMMVDIRDGMERISQIVRDLKTFAYPEASELKKEFKLIDAVNSAVRLTGQQNKLARMEIDVDNDLMVLGSQSHIVQVLINLIENSMHAIQSAGSEGVIKIAAGHLENGRVKLTLRDNGTGIDEKVVDKIFDPFFTTKDVGQGLGMGLSTCHTIINNHGGVLSVDSDGASYTEFSLDLEAA